MAYLLGATLSDGHVYIHPEMGRIRLEAKDREFVEEFYVKAKEAGLKPAKPRPVRGKWYVQLYSKHLAYLIKSGQWRQLLQTIEDKKAFLRGFFDGDGIALVPGYANTDLKLLEEVSNLLRDLGIRTSPPV
ncbi:MAG: hypothetical protein DRJ69_02505, partial [Thermoprotei archaeon]